MIRRDFYLTKLRAAMGNGLVKVITGIRRSGKSYLLFDIFKTHLLESGVQDDHIIAVQLDMDDYSDLRVPRNLSAWIKKRLPDDGKQVFVFIDEIQMCKPSAEEMKDPRTCVTFYDVLNSLMKRHGVDIYVTGSNSEMLSKDIATNFRDRGVEIRVWPLSFAEYYAIGGREKAEAWESYLVWGGMPLAVLSNDDADRASYLESLFDRVYFKDIIERYNLADDGYVLGTLVDVLASGIGSLTNPHRLALAMKSERKVDVSEPTVDSYVAHLEDSFLFNSAARWDVKGKRYLSYPSKYYMVDPGLRNARLNFRQTEYSHIMENVIYNDLLRRGYRVDVGVVETVEKDKDGKSVRKRREIDFVVNSGTRKIYIQSAFEIPGEEKREQETESLRKSGDFFKKVVIVGGSMAPRNDQDGILYVGVIPFLLDPLILEGLM